VFEALMAGMALSVIWLAVSVARHARRHRREETADRIHLRQVARDIQRVRDL